MRRMLIVIIIISSLIVTCHRCPEKTREVVIQEASGIVRVEDKLLIVDDDADGMYFEMELPEDPGAIIPIDPAKVKEVPLPSAELALDLESIDQLADGRITVLSEQLRCLVAGEDLSCERYTVIAEYDKTLTEFGNRGMEGLAVKWIDDDKSRVAVLWEGGYPEYNDIPLQFRNSIRGIPLKPIVVIHEINRGEIVGSVNKPLSYFALDVPEPEGEPPDAQRFRAVDLVWHNKKNGAGLKEELIVLLSSLNAPSDDAVTPKEYKIKILQRFNLQGEPVGNSLSLKDCCKNALNNLNDSNVTYISDEMLAHLSEVKLLLEKYNWENVNWEGLAWFEEGKSLVTIYDRVPKNPPFALIIEIPPDWE